MKRISGYASITWGSCSICCRTVSSRIRLSAANGPLFSSSRLKLRISRREVTITVSNNPELTRRRVANCCKPMQREHGDQRRYPHRDADGCERIAQQGFPPVTHGEAGEIVGFHVRYPS